MLWRGITADPVQRFAQTFRMPQPTAVQSAPCHWFYNAVATDTCNGPHHFTTRPGRGICTLHARPECAIRVEHFATRTPCLKLGAEHALLLHCSLPSRCAIPHTIRHPAQTSCSSACRCPAGASRRHGGARRTTSTVRARCVQALAPVTRRPGHAALTTRPRYPQPSYAGAQ